MQRGHILSMNRTHPLRLLAELNYADWKENRRHLHMWTQLSQIRRDSHAVDQPFLHVHALRHFRGLTTRRFRTELTLSRSVSISIDHQLRILKKRRGQRSLTETAQRGGFSTRRHGRLNELDLAARSTYCRTRFRIRFRFDRDEQHRSYDPKYANRFWRVLVQTTASSKGFRSRFCGKCSPVHFFWGAPDLAVTRFSGPDRARSIPGHSAFCRMRSRGKRIPEVSSLGFWPGADCMPMAIFSFAYPEPTGFSEAKVKPGSGLL